MCRLNSGKFSKIPEIQLAMLINRGIPIQDVTSQCVGHVTCDKCVDLLYCVILLDPVTT